jgi:nitrogen regulatory protein P-II 1
MKKIEAIVRAWFLEPLLTALTARGIEGLTVSEVVGFGDEPGRRASYRGTTRILDSHPRLRIEVVVPDGKAGPIARAIVRVARTGDGLVTISPVKEAFRIRTRERGLAAITTPPGPTGVRARLHVVSRSAPR